LPGCVGSGSSGDDSELPNSADGEGPSDNELESILRKRFGRNLRIKHNKVKFKYMNILPILLLLGPLMPRIVSIAA
jgi:hypothetical protein